MQCATATSPKRRGGSICIAARCNAFWPSARHADRYALLATRANDKPAGAITARSKDALPPAQPRELFAFAVYNGNVNARQFGGKDSCGTRPGEAHGHGPARCRGHAMFRCLPENLRTVAIGQDEPAFFRKDFSRHLRVRRKEEPIRMQPVFGPFAVHTKILHRRFNLDDPD